MATWKSGRTWDFQDEHSNGPDIKISWDYSTTSDTLAINEDIPELICAYGSQTYPANVNRKLMGRPKAFALYQALRDWIRVYEGEKTLERLDQATESETNKPDLG